MNKITRHHRITKSHWGNNHYDNIAKLWDVKHRALHTLFADQILHQQVQTLVDLTWKAINKNFREDIVSVLWDYELDEMYNEKCCNMNKLVSHILETKNN